MCTLVGKHTPGKLVVIANTPCCIAVEEIEALNPKYSRANGWTEIAIDEIAGDLPGWTHWTLYKSNGRLPPGLPLTTDDGRRLVWIDLDEDVCRHFPDDPVAALTYRGTTIHFRTREHLTTLRDFVQEKLRNPAAYEGFERYLQMIPTRFLRATDRTKVVKQLDKLLENLSS